MEWFCIATACGLALAGAISILLLVRDFRRRGEKPRVRGRLGRVAWLARFITKIAVAVAALAPALLPSSWIVALLSAPEAPAEIDALVVLGGGLTPEGRLGITTRERLDHAITLGTGRWVPLYVSGGPGTAPRMSKYLQNSGLPLSAIEVDNSSYTTTDNAAHLCPALKQARRAKVAIVTSPYHSGRALVLFRDSCADIDFVARSTAPTRLLEAQSWLTVKTALICEGAKRVHATLF